MKNQLTSDDTLLNVIGWIVCLLIIFWFWTMVLALFIGKDLLWEIVKYWILVFPLYL